jgi:hypothetical protein
VNIVSLKQGNDFSSNDDLHLATNEPDSDDKKVYFMIKQFVAQQRMCG